NCRSGHFDELGVQSFVLKVSPLLSQLIRELLHSERSKSNPDLFWLSSYDERAGKEYRYQSYDRNNFRNSSKRKNHWIRPFLLAHLSPVNAHGSTQEKSQSG